jgi:hypothetical protein
VRNWAPNRGEVDRCCLGPRARAAVRMIPRARTFLGSHPVVPCGLWAPKSRIWALRYCNVVLSHKHIGLCTFLGNVHAVPVLIVAVCFYEELVKRCSYEMYDVHDVHDLDRSGVGPISSPIHKNFFFNFLIFRNFKASVRKRSSWRIEKCPRSGWGCMGGGATEHHLKDHLHPVQLYPLVRYFKFPNFVTSARARRQEATGKAFI